MEKIKLVDLIDVATLQKFQDGFADVMGVAALTTDTKGVELTKGSNFTDYCMKCIRSSEKGRIECQKCDSFGAERTLETGKSVAYVCHSGLVDFAAPIMANGEMVGSFIGGQVLYEAPNEENVRQIAEDYGIDFDELWIAINEIPIVPKEKVDKAADFLSTVASTLSDVAYAKVMADKANEEISSAAAMKSNFLANMSHEIRTPMNAVIGMAEMALREELPNNARNYVNQIKSSGRALLGIINDILDYSKIESGKMDILPVEYEPLSLFYDVANVVMTKLRDSEVELLLSMNPDLPKLMVGDNNRIRQILINLANNAVKFTKRGYVDIKLDYEKIDNENVVLKVRIKDTGIGIRKEDLGKLFSSFQQVDSKRNRNVEGTGLGLAISKNLLEIMGGSISVESEYEKGSVFSFELPQKVVDWGGAVSVEGTGKAVALGYWNHPAMSRHFIDDAKALGIFALNIMGLDTFDDVIEAFKEEFEGKNLYFFFDETSYDDKIKGLLDSHQGVTGVMLTGFYSKTKSDRHNLRLVKKPMSTLCISMAINNIEMLDSAMGDENFNIDFTAPDAKILIVDDNAINITVAEGLLEPLKMKTYSAMSGVEAIRLMDEEQFDIVFMDHMMPGMDGVETTRVIRRMYPKCAETPIIALTANAMEGTKDMFLSEGMNDFVAKPIEIRTIVNKIRQWLPLEKIIEMDEIDIQNADSQSGPAISSETIVIGDLDTDTARKMLGSDKLFFNILKEYYRNIPGKIASIKRSLEAEDWPAYTIEVHALKSTSKQIGAMHLSAEAAEMEKAGNSRDIEAIMSRTKPMLQEYEAYLKVLEPYCVQEELLQPEMEYDMAEVMKLLEEMAEAYENLDMDMMEEIIEKMSGYAYPDEQEEMFNALKIATDNIDIDGGNEIIAKWRTLGVE